MGDLEKYNKAQQAAPVAGPVLISRVSSEPQTFHHFQTSQVHSIGRPIYGGPAQGSGNMGYLQPVVPIRYLPAAVGPRHLAGNPPRPPLMMKQGHVQVQQHLHHGHIAYPVPPQHMLMAAPADGKMRVPGELQLPSRCHRSTAVKITHPEIHEALMFGSSGQASLVAGRSTNHSPFSSRNKEGSVQQNILAASRVTNFYPLLVRQQYAHHLPAFFLPPKGFISAASSSGETTRTSIKKAWTETVMRNVIPPRKRMQHLISRVEASHSANTAEKKSIAHREEEPAESAFSSEIFPALKASLPQSCSIAGSGCNLSSVEKIQQNDSNNQGCHSATAKASCSNGCSTGLPSVSDAQAKENCPGDPPVDSIPSKAEGTDQVNDTVNSEALTVSSDQTREHTKKKSKRKNQRKAYMATKYDERSTNNPAAASNHHVDSGLCNGKWGSENISNMTSTVLEPLSDVNVNIKAPSKSNSASAKVDEFPFPVKSNQEFSVLNSGTENKVEISLGSAILNRPAVRNSQSQSNDVQKGSEAITPESNILVAMMNSSRPAASGNLCELSVEAVVNKSNCSINETFEVRKVKNDSGSIISHKEKDPPSTKKGANRKKKRKDCVLKVDDCVDNGGGQALEKKENESKLTYERAIAVDIQLTNDMATKIPDNSQTNATELSMERVNTKQSTMSNCSGSRKYSREFLLSFKDKCKALPSKFENRDDIAEILSNNAGYAHQYQENNESPNSAAGGNANDVRYNRPSVHSIPSQDTLEKLSSVIPGQASTKRTGNLKRNGCKVAFIKSSPLNAASSSRVSVSSLSRSRFVKSSSMASARWPRTSRRGSRFSTRNRLPIMHKADNKYKIGIISDEEDSKQRQIKAILNKLTPQNFEKLFAQVKQVNICSAFTLTGFISQIFDKALMEPTFCEMYAKMCAQLSAELPEFYEDDQKITFKRVLLNKCQEEFERGEREQATAAEEEGEDEREEKQARGRRRMLGNIRFIGELYKKSMLTERIMHDCIRKLLGLGDAAAAAAGKGSCHSPDKENVESLCKLLSTIGPMMDSPKAREHMDAYFQRIAQLSQDPNLSFRLRFMLRDLLDLRRNAWRHRRQEELPRKIEDIHRDAAALQPHSRSPSGARSSASASASSRGQHHGSHASSSSSSSFKNSNNFFKRGQASHQKNNAAVSVTASTAPCSATATVYDSSSTEALPQRVAAPVVQKNRAIRSSCNEQLLRQKSSTAINEFYSTNDMTEVGVRLEEMKAPWFHSKMVCHWISDCFEGKDGDSLLLADLLIYLCDSRPNILTHQQLAEGLKVCLLSLDEEVVDAPKVPKLLGELLARLVAAEVMSLAQCAGMVKDAGRTVNTGLLLQVVLSMFQYFITLHGESYLLTICRSSRLLLEDFMPLGTNPSHFDEHFNNTSFNFLYSLGNPSKLKNPNTHGVVPSFR